MSKVIAPTPPPNPQKLLNELNRIKDGFSMTKGKAMDMITEANGRQWQAVLDMIQGLLGENQKLQKQLEDARSRIPKQKTIQKTEKPPKNTK